MKKRNVVLFTLFIFASGLFLVSTAHAQTFLGDMFKQLVAAGGVGGANYPDPQDPRLVVVTIIKLILTLVGTIVFALMVYAGFTWMTAGGNDKKVTQAKVTIRNTVIGLIVILSAYGLTIAATNLALGRNLGSGASTGVSLDSAVQSAVAGSGTGK